MGIRLGAPRRLGAVRGCALSMAEAKGASWRAVPAVRRDRSGCASLMEVVAAASYWVVPRVLKGVPCFVKHMVVESVVYLQGAQKVLKAARRCAKDTVEASAAFLTGVGFAQKAFTEARIFVLPTVVGRGVPLQGARRAHVGVLIAASSMVEGSVASLKTVGRVPKEAPPFARPTVGESGATGEERENARNLPEGREDYVPLTAAWFRRGTRTREE